MVSLLCEMQGSRPASKHGGIRTRLSEVRGAVLRVQNKTSI